MPLAVRNLSYLQGLDPRLHELVSDIINGVNTVEQQTQTNVNGDPPAPPPPNAMSVSGQNGFLHVAITDQSEFYRGVQYYTEHADNPQFTNPQIVTMGSTRNVTIPVGNQSRYVRVYKSYPFSPPSTHVVHGGSVPRAVSGGGTNPGPVFLPSQGSGTGGTGVGGEGPGRVPYRSATGKPPVRA